MFNRTPIADLLLARDAQIDACDANGMTALKAAHVMGAAEAAEQLAKRKH